MTIFKAFMQFCLHLPGKKETTLLPLEIVTSCLEMKAKDVSVVHDFSKLIEKRGICQIDRSSTVTHNFYKYSCADWVGEFKALFWKDSAEWYLKLFWKLMLLTVQIQSQNGVVGPLVLSIF